MSKKICVVGDVILDAYYFGVSKRISPEAPIPILENPNEEYKLGGAANVAANISNIGFDVSLIGKVGNDKNGDIVKKLLKKNKIKSLMKVIKNEKTIIKKRFISNNQQILRVDDEKISNEDYNNFIKKKIVDGNFSYIIFSDYNKGFIGNISSILKLCRSKGIVTLVDPKKSSLNYYKFADFIKPNTFELSKLLENEPKNIKDGIEIPKLIKKYDLKFILNTKSEKGMDLYSKKGIEMSISSSAKEVKDVTGAGDTVISSMCASLAYNLDVYDSVKVANECASYAVDKVGAYLMDKVIFEQIKKEFLTLSGVKQDFFMLPNLKKSSKKVVFTNGCFDIFHLGHLKFLKEAKSLGDILVVGINSDISIKKIKGEKRPINNLEDRYNLISNLGIVDFVVAFNEGTPKKLIKKIKPDLLLKAGDYNLNEIVGKNFVESYGGEVMTLKYHSKYSTTSVIKKIAKKK